MDVKESLSEFVLRKRLGLCSECLKKGIETETIGLAFTFCKKHRNKKKNSLYYYDRRYYYDRKFPEGNRAETKRDG